MKVEKSRLIFNAIQNSVKLIIKNNFRENDKNFDAPTYFLQTIAFYIEYCTRLGKTVDSELLTIFKKYTNYKTHQLLLCAYLKDLSKKKYFRFLFSKKFTKALFYNSKLCFPPFIKIGFPFLSGPAVFIFSSILDSIILGISNNNFFNQLDNTFKIYHFPDMRCPSINMEIIRCYNMIIYSKFYDNPLYLGYAREVFENSLKTKLFRDGGINDSFNPQEISISNAYATLSYYYLIKINKHLQESYIEEYLQSGRKFLFSLISPSGRSFFIGRSNGYLWPHAYLLNILYYYNERELIEEVLSNILENFVYLDKIKWNSSGKLINPFYGPCSTYNMLFAAKFAEFYQKYKYAEE